MGFFDSKKKTTNNNTTNDYTTTTTDNRYAELSLGDGAAGIAGDVAGAVNITTSDSGAIAAGSQIALGALEYGADSAELAYGALGDTLDTGASLAGKTIDFSKDALTDTINQITGSAQDFAQLTQRSLEQTQSAYLNANTSEDSRTSQKLIMYIGIIVALWVLSPVLQKLFKG